MSNFIFGIHAVSAVLQRNPQRIQQLLIVSARRDQRVQALLDLAKREQIPIQTLSKQECEHRFADAVHQGVIAEVSARPSYAEADLMAWLQQWLQDEHVPYLLILDGVTDPHNLGACLRTADAAGVDAVICPKDRAATINATVEKVACGAVESVPLISVTNLARTMKVLQQQGVWLFGTSDRAQQSLYACDLTGPLALVMGAEGKGLRRLTEENCDHLVAIPMQGDVSSLNVSVATGVCLFEGLRQRRQANPAN